MLRKLQCCSESLTKFNRCTNENDEIMKWWRYTVNENDEMMKWWTHTVKQMMKWWTLQIRIDVITSVEWTLFYL